jgi:seryl-tRNA synthetase
MRQGKKEEAEIAKTRTAEIKESIKQFDIDFAAIEEQVYQFQVQLPNLPADLVPEGKGAADNLVVKSGGEIPERCMKMHFLTGNWLQNTILSILNWV